MKENDSKLGRTVIVMWQLEIASIAIATIMIHQKLIPVMHRDLQSPDGSMKVHSSPIRIRFNEDARLQQSGSASRRTFCKHLLSEFCPRSIQHTDDPSIQFSGQAGLQFGKLPRQFSDHIGTMEPVWRNLVLPRSSFIRLRKSLKPRIFENRMQLVVQPGCSS